MTILFDVLLRVARQVTEDVWESTATGGSATTLVDSSANVEADDFWNGGTLFFKSGSTGRINTTAVITDFTKLTGTFTVATGVALATGNTYLALTPAIPLANLIRAVNNALKKQTLITEDETTDIVASQYDYSLPAGVSNVLAVYFGNDTDGWERSNTWGERNGELTFYAYEPGTADDHIRILYWGNHGEVGASSDTINAQINVDLLVFDALAELWGQRAMRSDENPRAKDRQAFFYQEAEKLRNRKAKKNSATKYTGL